MSNRSDAEEWKKHVEGLLDNDIHEVTMAEIEKLRKELQQTAEAEFEKCNEKTFVEFGAYQQEEIRRIFTESVDSFYSSYKPKYYTRTGGLYELLSMQTAGNGTVLLDGDNYETLYDERLMHPHRSGGKNLFNTVFVEGYHGGADSINATRAEIWGSHPSPGTPYYRRPGLVKSWKSNKRFWHKYGKWGRAAVQTKSPYSMISEELDDITGTSMFEKLKEISRKHFDSAVDQINKAIPEILQRYY